MNKQTGNNRETEELQQRAERELAAKSEKNTALALLDAKRLVHELQVHQIELELQNKSLQEAQAQAEEAQKCYMELFDFAPIAYFTLGNDGVIQRTNFRGANLLGFERSKISGQNFIHNVSHDDRPVFNRFIQEVFASDNALSCKITLKLGDIDCCVAIEAVADNTRQSCLAAVSDISVHKRIEEELQLAATVYLALGEAIMVADKNNRIVAVNPAFTRLTGYAAKDAVGQPASLLKPLDWDKAFYQDQLDTLKASGHWEGEISIRCKNGDMRIQWLSISSVFDEKGEAIRQVSMISDFTEKRQAEALISKQASIDPLTELPNRRLFLDRLQRAINKSHRTKQQFALMFLDLDNFKDVNDTLGHHVGDILLKETAERLKCCIRETDTLARPGGDEFTIIIDELDENSSVDRVAQAIQDRMTIPFHLGVEDRNVSFSIGITVYPDDSTELDDLLKKADQAMYSAKQQGRNCFCYFTPMMQEAAESRLRLTNDLRKVFIKRQLWVAYQPIVDLATGSVHKAEALIRWRHPTLGLVLPSEFIHIAEDTGMITELGDWVFKQAANQAKRWRKTLHPSFQISINKSPKQFCTNHNHQTLWFKHLRGLGLPSASISLEITESLLLDDSPIVTELLVAYRDAGMHISLDDFGVGYSSLSYLKKFKIDFLKIDQAFVCNLPDNSTDKVLCEAIILMAHKLGMKVIAEGIETPEQRDFLIQAGCDYGQGYLFSRPVPAKEFERLFQA